MFEKIKITEKEILRYCNNHPNYILVQFVDENDAAGLEEEIRLIESYTDKKFAFMGIRTASWNDELSPWEAEPVFGRQGFGGKQTKILTILRKI